MKLLRKVILGATAAWAASLLAFWMTSTVYTYESDLKARKELLHSKTAALAVGLEQNLKLVIEQARLAWRAAQFTPSRDGTQRSKAEIERNLEEIWSAQKGVSRFQVFKRKGSHTDFEWIPYVEWSRADAPPVPYDLVPRFGLAFEGFVETISFQSETTANPPSLYFAISVKREKYNTPKEMIGIQLESTWIESDFDEKTFWINADGMVFASSKNSAHPRGTSLKHWPIVAHFLSELEQKSQSDSTQTLSGTMEYSPFPKEPKVLAEYREIAGTGSFLLTTLALPSWIEHTFFIRKDRPMILFSFFLIGVAASLFALSVLTALRRAFKTRQVRETTHLTPLTAESITPGPKETSTDFDQAA